MDEHRGGLGYIEERRASPGNVFHIVGSASHVMEHIDEPAIPSPGSARDARHGTVEHDAATLARAMEAALWSAIALVAALSTGTLFVLIAKIDGLASRLDGRIDALSARIDGLGADTAGRFDAMSGRIDALTAGMNGRFDRVDDRLTRVERELHRHVTRHAG